MKVIITIGLIAYSLAVIAQTKVEKTFQVPTGNKLQFYFDFPELIKVHTWDNKDVLIKGMVSINQGENDQAFELNANSSGNIFTISSTIRDMDNLPRRTTIKIGEQEYHFKTGNSNDPEIKKFLAEKGGSYQYMTNGVDIDITLEIFVPRGMECVIESKFGLVEIRDFYAPLRVTAPHGGIDATITATRTGSLTARTKFGEILTNLEAKFNPTGVGGEHDHWTEVKASFGNGPKYDFESKFGKVYLRKP